MGTMAAILPTEKRFELEDDLQVLLNHEKEKQERMFRNLNGPVSIGLGVHIFDFDLESRVHDITFANGINAWNWVSRSLSNYWTFYDSMNVNREQIELIDGQYQTMPELLTFGKSIIENPEDVQDMFKAYDEMIKRVRLFLEKGPAPLEIKTILENIALKDRTWLFQDGKRLHKIINGDIPILPPDTFFEDYSVIPIILQEGCGNSCDGCLARIDSPFSIRKREDVQRQIQELKLHIGSDLPNYNSIVFGQNNALASGADLLEFGATQAYAVFELVNSYQKKSNLFMFATNKTLLESPEKVFETLEKLPYSSVSINVGWEAATNKNLRVYGKPQTASEVLEGMIRAREINETYQKVKINGNFLIGCEFDKDHLPSVIHILNESRYQGRIYVSPFHNNMRTRITKKQAMVQIGLIGHHTTGVGLGLYKMHRL